MNSKAIRKQLLAAVAMVLVAAVALGSSTYAWFVQSGSVTATGMKVNVQSDGGLVIRYGDEGGWGITASAGMDTTTLYPASTATMQEWAYAKAQYSTGPAALNADRQDITSKVFTGGNVETFNTGADNTYVVMKDFYIRSSNPSLLGSGLYVSNIEVTTPKQLTSTALRVGIMLKNADSDGFGTKNTPFIFGPVKVNGSDVAANTASPTYTYVSAKAGDNYKETEVTLKTIGDTTPIVQNGTAIPGKDGTPVHVWIFLWYEGEDHNLYTDILHPEALDITIEFSSYSYAPPAP